MSPRPPFALFPCLLLAALSACRGGGAAAATPVLTRVLVPSDWNEVLQSLGTVKAHESVTLTAKLSEMVEAVHFESGQQVAAGQACAATPSRPRCRRRRPSSAMPTRCTCASASWSKSSSSPVPRWTR